MWLGNRKMKNNGRKIKITIRLQRACNLMKEDLVNFRIPVLVVAIVLVTMKLVFHQLCPVKKFLGIPCPGCGLTHGCFYVLTFQWRQAWNWNPTSFLWVPSILFWIVNRYVLEKNEKWVLGVFSVTCIVTMVRYAVVMINAFTIL